MGTWNNKSCVWKNCSLQEEEEIVVYEDIRWKVIKIILVRERAGITNYWYLDDRGEREGIKTLDNRELEEGVK